MTAEEWVRRFAADAGVEPPTPQEFDQILKLAAIAAHGSQRTAAPVACWIGGATRLPAESLREIAAGISPEAE